MSEVLHTEVAIVGAGFSGLGMGVRLKQDGVRFLILDGSDRVGGTWRDNTYPGVACDVPSHLYSFSFAPNPDWQHVYSAGHEIQRYLERCVDEFGLKPHLRLGRWVQAARFDAAQAEWVLALADGATVRARFLVAGAGALRDPFVPPLPGIDRFQGTMVHSAQWPDHLDVTGQRVGVVGTGASAIQIAPALAPRAAHLTVFQRTPPWIRERRDRAYTDAERATFRHVPGALLASRLATWMRNEAYYPLVFGRLHPIARLLEPLLKRELQQRVGNAALADRVTPAYRMGCKRILLSDDWYDTLARDDVSLVDEAVHEVTETGVRLAGGREVPLDVIVWCTGFRVSQPLGDLQVTGLDEADLADAWGDRPRAYLGITVPRFPNFFLLLGPNTALGHSSVVIMIEAQIRYVRKALRWLRAQPGTPWLDLRPEPLERFMEAVDQRHEQRVWMTGCDSWYLGPDGSNFTLWPGSTARYIARTWSFDPTDYQLGVQQPSAVR